MKTLKDFVKEKTGRGKIIRKFRVPSKSNPELKYLVELDDENNLFCECPAGAFKNKCSHQKIVEKWIKK